MEEIIQLHYMDILLAFADEQWKKEKEMEEEYIKFVDDLL